MYQKSQISAVGSHNIGEFLLATVDSTNPQDLRNLGGFQFHGRRLCEACFSTCAFFMAFAWAGITGRGKSRSDVIVWHGVVGGQGLEPRRADK